MQYQFSFVNDVLFQCAEVTLTVAKAAAAGIAGETNVTLELSTSFDPRRRTICLTSSGDAGEYVIQAFTGLLLRELGENGFQVRRVEGDRPAAAQPVQVAEGASA